MFSSVKMFLICFVLGVIISVFGMYYLLKPAIGEVLKFKPKVTANKYSRY
jgi:hypothetical protein